MITVLFSPTIDSSEGTPPQADLEIRSASATHGPKRATYGARDTFDFMHWQGRRSQQVIWVLNWLADPEWDDVNSSIRFYWNETHSGIGELEGRLGS